MIKLGVGFVLGWLAKSYWPDLKAWVKNTWNSLQK